MAPVVLAGNYILKSHPNGAQLCEYLQNDTYLGRLIVPEKYSSEYREQHRAAQYDKYLKSGLPIPPEYIPKDDRIRAQFSVKAGDAAMKTAQPFQPQITMNMGAIASGTAQEKLAPRCEFS